jgi:hypothetical protein
MSFICEHTGEVIGPGVPQHKVVVQWRKKTYKKPIKRYGKIVDFELKEGREIAKEINVGPDAYKALTGLEPKRGDQKKRIARAERVVERNTKPVRPWRNPRIKGKNKDNNRTPSNRKPVVEKVNRLPVK